jgi:hypothetical protein
MNNARYSLASRAIWLTLVAVSFSAFAASEADDRILLNSGPIQLERTNSSEAMTATAFTGKRLHLVQFAEAVKPEWFAALAETGSEIVTYIPNNAYLIYGDAAALAKVRSLDPAGMFIRGEGPYRDDFKTGRLLGPSITPNGKQNEASGLFAVQLIHDPPANAATLQLIDAARLENVASQYRILHYLNVVVKLPEQALRGLAQRPDVISIQPYGVPRKLDERQDQIVAGNLTLGVPTGPGYLGWLASKGFTQAQFTASGFLVDVSDSGIDDGTNSPNHFALYRDGVFPGGVSRVLYNRLEGTANPGSTLMGCDGHGTLNAHLVGGFDNLAGFPHVDSSGFHYGLGVAPFVRLGSSVIFDPDAFTFPNFPNLQSKAFNDGARISNNSWGTYNGGAYDITAQAFDALTRDAQPAGSTFPVAGNQEMVMVVAAGNAGPSIQTVASPASAKNVFTVGAAESVQSIGGADACSVADSDANSANDLTSLSSRGPTMDGRRKPDLVAPGTHVSGGLVQVASPGVNGQADVCFSGSGICGGLASNFFPAGQQFFTASSGTSHSAPAVAGASALLRQFFINQSLTPPSPAMTRAYLINSTRYLTGVGAADALWSVGQGMGSVHLGTAFDGAPRIVKDQVPADVFTASGQTRTYTGSVADSAKPVRVTLVWTDAPGSTTGAAYNNNLDLVLTIGGTAYLGNVFSTSFSIAGGSADLRNNVESVFIPPGISGNFAVSVKATNINSDGVPNVGGPLDQDFALVVYNAVESPTAVVMPNAAQLMAENCSPPNSAVDPDETVTVQFGITNGGTAPTTNLIATLEESGGVAGPGPPQNYGAIAPGDPAVFRSFVFRASGSCGGVITPVLRLQDGATDLGTVRFAIPLGVDAGGTAVRQNAATIVVPSSGAATPYPSAIAVSGITGTVTKVTVTLPDVSHTSPDDLDILLVGPLGQKVMLMSDAGEGPDLTNVALTFDDAAPFALPDGPGIVSGTYKPSDYESGDAFPAPAPGFPFGTALSVFNGADPNGTWNLYVVDDDGFDQGTISGWSLNITTFSPSCCVLPGSLQFTASTFSQVEGPAGGRIHISRLAGTAGSVSVTITTSNGTAQAGSDYVATTETVTFAPGNNQPKLVIVPILDDPLDEDDETINLQLSNPTGGAVLGAPSTAVLTVQDNDPLPTISVDDETVTEGSSGTIQLEFTVSLSAASARDISVNYATAAGTATAGTDYVSTAGPLQFPAGTTTRTINVTVNGDLSNEADETFFLNLTDPINTTAGDLQGTATIISDDILTVSSIGPDSGPAGGGTGVTIQGTSFEAGASVTFGGIAATSVMVVSPTEITCVTPSMPAGTLNDVAVTNVNSLSAALAKGFLADFLDVPGSHPFHNAIETIFRNGITAGCGGGNFCINAGTNRAQMALFLLRGKYGAAYQPPPPTGVFADVPPVGIFAAFIEQIYAEGITAGCATNPLRYCPQDPVTRAQMAVFLLRSEHGSTYDPPPATGIFEDVPLTHPFVEWIEQLYSEGITAGCSTVPPRFCPGDSVSRGQMAVFLSGTFDLD